MPTCVSLKVRQLNPMEAVSRFTICTIRPKLKSDFFISFCSFERKSKQGDGKEAYQREAKILECACACMCACRMRVGASMYACVCKCM